MKVLLTLAMLLTMTISLGAASGCKDKKEPSNSSTSSQTSGSTSSQSASSSSAADELVYHAVTFQQDGYEDIVMVIKNGEGIANVPQPKPKEGYTVTWEVQDFSNITADILIKAIETPNEYTITFDANGGVVTPASTKISYDAELPSLPIPTQEGKFFVAWTYEDKAITGGAVWKIASDVTLTATWRDPAIYEVVFVQNGQTIKTVQITEGTSFVGELPALVTTGEGYEGYDWAWEDFDRNNITGSIVVRALQTAKTYTVTINAGEGGSFLDGKTTLQVSAQYNKKVSWETPTRKGYKFLGWYDENDAKVDIDTPWRRAADGLVLTAKWEIKKFTVNFDLNRGLGNFPSITITYGDSYSFNAPGNWDTTGMYKFGGWYYGGEKVELSGIWEYDFASPTITLTAEWTKEFTNDY